MQSTNAEYVENMFEKWNANKSSVPSSWDSYFKNLLRGVDSHDSFINPFDLKSDDSVKISTTTTSINRSYVSDYLRLRLLIESYRIRGHQFADLDPLELDTTVRGAVHKGSPISH